MKKEILSDYEYFFNEFSGTCIQKLNDVCATQNDSPNECCAFDYIYIQTEWRPTHMLEPGVVGEAPITQSYPTMKTCGFIKSICNEKIVYK